MTFPTVMPSLRLIPASLLAAACLLLSQMPLRAQTTSTTGTTDTTGTTTTGTTTPAATSTGTGSSSENTTAGPLAVFRLSFSATGQSINYRPYQGGYYVTPLEGGTGSIILTLITGNTKQYFTYQSFGDSFVAVGPTSNKMVFSATASSDVSTTVFYALGNTDTDVNSDFRNGTASLKVASSMTGYAVSADSEKDLPFSGTGSSVGVAGVSILTAKYDDTLTHSANEASNTVGDAINTIIAQLTKSGYSDGLANSTGGAAPSSASTSSTSTSSTSTTGTTGTTTTGM